MHLARTKRKVTSQERRHRHDANVNKRLRPLVVILVRSKDVHANEQVTLTTKNSWGRCYCEAHVDGELVGLTLKGLLV